MAFGVISTTALLSLGIPPAQASAAVHTAEVATTGVSGLSHLYYRNIHRKLLFTLAMAGVLGGVLGAYVLSNIDGRAIRPLVSAYLLVIGLLILIKAVKLAPTNEDAKVGYAAPLGLVGGFLDAIGGGGDEAFSFIGTAGFTGVGQLRVTQVGADTLVQGNTAGGSGAEFEIRLAGVTASSLVAEDFIL